MPISVSNQAYIFLCSVIGGMIIGFIYDVFRIKRKAIKTATLVIYLEDLLYWVLVALIMFGTVYYSNDGEIRGFIFVGTLIGVILYVLLLSKIVIGTSIFFIKTIVKIAKTIWNILTYPIKVIIKLVSIPLKIIGGFLSKRLRKARKIGKIRMDRIALWSRILRNIRKKI